VCAGRHVANNVLFIEIVTILWAMKLEPGKNSDGKVFTLDLNAEAENGLIMYVLCIISILKLINCYISSDDHHHFH